MKLFVIYILVILSVPVFAQMIPPDTIVIPEFEIISKPDESPGGMVFKTIDTLVLQNENSVSLSDLLDTYSSLFIKNEGRGALSTVSFRGTASSHTDVLWNGISVKSPMLGQIDFSLFPVYLSDNISISAGNSSLAKTSGALGGAISLNNKADWTKPLHFSILSGAGSYGTYNEFMKFNLVNKHFFSGTRMYFITSKNDFSFKNKNIATINRKTGKYEFPVQKNNHADYKLYGFEQYLEWRINKKSIVKANYWFQNSKRSLPRLNTYEGDDYSNINKQYEQTHHAKIEYVFLNKKSKLSLSSGLITQNMTYTLENIVSGKGFVFAVNSFSKVFSSYNKASYNFGFVKNAIFKVEYNFNYHHVITIDSVKQKGYNRYRQEDKFLFLWEQKIGRHFSASVLLRKEWVNGNQIPLIPYAGFEWLAKKKSQWKIRINVARNYNYPSLNDLYWQPGGNSNLQPEEGICVEAGTQMVFKTKNLSLKPDITFFYNNIDKWILWLPAPVGYWQAQNIKKVIVKGLDLSLKAVFHIKQIKFIVQGNYAFTRSLNRGEADVWGIDAINKQLPYVPVHSGNLLLSILWHGFEINYINNSYSERFTTSTNNLTRRDWLYPYFMNNIYFLKNISLKKVSFKIEIKVYNIFNEEYRSVLGRPMPGRNYMILLNFKL